MSKIRLSDGIVKDEVLVIGLASNLKGGIAIEAGDLSIDAKSLLALLSDMGATGKIDEVVKIPSSFVRVLV
jgi:leucyl aminopeptidase